MGEDDSPSLIPKLVICLIAAVVVTVYHYITTGHIRALLRIGRRVNIPTNNRSFTQSMIKATQAVSEEDGDMDKISSLPRDVIDCIMEVMPVLDAARTCVLSSNWRYIWANHPALIVDKKFWDSMKQKRLSEEVPIDFAVDTLKSVLLHHIGPINKFVLDLSVVRSERHCDVDICLSFLSRRGVKVLELDNSTSNPYTIPACVFLNSDLTSLSISNCILKTTKSSTSLPKLQNLIMNSITLSPWVLETPLLRSLTLKLCRGIHDFIISAPGLVSVKLKHKNDLNLFPFLKCSDINFASIFVGKKIEYQRRDGESINLMKLLTFWPKMSTLFINGLSLECLTRSIVLEEFELKLPLTHFLPFSINLNLGQIAWVLRILQNSPRLHTFEIWFSRHVNNDLEVMNYLEELNIMNPRMAQLRVVKMKYFKASRTELLFAKVLLRSAPSLERILMEEDENLGLGERLRISKEFMKLPRASLNVEIIFGSEVVTAAKKYY